MLFSFNSRNPAENACYEVIPLESGKMRETFPDCEMLKEYFFCESFHHGSQIYSEK